MKVKLFTHTDLDGVGCAVVAAEAFGKYNVDITYCDYDKIDSKVSNFLSSISMNDYDLVLITDISVNEAIAEIIDQTINSTTYYSDVDMMPRKLILLDHHATASWLNKYWWATVTPIKSIEYIPPAKLVGESITLSEFFAQSGKIEGTKTAGTSMLYDFCMSNGYLGSLHDKSLGIFAETVRRWDTWDWINVYGGEELPKTLNSYLYLIGRDRFFDRFTNNNSIQFADGEKLVLELEAERIKTYIEKVSRGVQKLNISGYNVGLVFAEQYQSELGNAIAKDNPDIDFAVIVNLGGKTVSYRGVKPEFDLGDIVKPLGGGGHPPAAGSKIPDSVVNGVIGFIGLAYLNNFKGRD